MKARTFLAVVFIGLIWTSLGKADDGTWVRIGTPANLTKFSDISVCYQNNQRQIFAAESSGVSHIWQSTDDGLNWLSPIYPVSGHYYKQIIMDPTLGQNGWALVPGNSYTDQESGPYKTTDLGQHWNLQEEGLENAKWVKCLAVNINSENLNVAYVGCEANPAYNVKILKTTNGTVWNASDVGLPTELGGVRDISLCEGYPNHLYCAYIAGPGGSQSGLYYSSDSGQLWQLKLFDGDAYPFKVAVSPTDPNVVYVVEHFPNYGRIYMTTDGGTSWTYLQNSSPGAKVSQIKFTRQGTNQRVYVAFSSSIDGQFQNHPWAMETGVDDQPTYLPSAGKIPGNRCAFSVGVDPVNPDHVFVGCQRMLYGSSDGGDSFTEMPGINPLPVPRLAVDLPVMFVQSDNMTFSCEDGEQDFVSEPVDTFSAGAVVRDWGSDKWILGIRHDVGQIGGNGSLFYYPFDFDGIGPLLPGWKQIDSWDGTAINCVATDPTNDYIYVGGNGPGMEVGRFYYGTIEGGFQFSNPPEGFTTVIPLAIDVRPGRYTVIVGGLDFCVGRSPDHGQTWEQIGHWLQCLVLSLQYCPYQPKIALAGTEYLGVYKCSNMDAVNIRPNWPIWSQSLYGITQGHNPALKFHPSDNSIVYVSVDLWWEEEVGQTFLSADTARSWIRMDNGLGDLIIHEFAADIDYPDTCYVATDDGVYKLKNPVKSGALVESEIWGPGTIVVNGDVIIPAGVTLTIEPGTTVKFVYNFDKFGSGSSSVKSEILVYGTLNANGETGNEIVFQSSRHELDPNGNDWYGIYAGVGSNITMNNCIVREADYGIFGYKVGDLTVQKCLFDHIGSTGIYLSLYQYSNPPQESLHLKVLQG